MNEYKLIKNLGSGAFGKVKLGVKKILDIEEFYAVKIFKKSILKRRREIVRDENGKASFHDGIQGVFKEIAVMKKLDHKNVIRLHEVINDEEDDKIYLIMDYAEKG